jgi:hypothetical protein
MKDQKNKARIIIKNYKKLQVIIYKNKLINNRRLKYAKVKNIKMFLLTFEIQI